MLTNREALQMARERVASRSRQDYGLLAAYACGSILGEEFLLGGAGDIDLVLVHMGAPEVEREIVPLTREVHLDIAHHDQRRYLQPRQVRLHPWLGPALKEGTVLHDPQHFLDFTLASVRGQFDRPDFTLARARQLLEQAQAAATQLNQADLPEPAQLRMYLSGLENAANAIASLSGAPLPERRLVLEFPARAAAIERPGLAKGLLGLLGAGRLADYQLEEWISCWQQAYHALPATPAPPSLQSPRQPYYLQAMRALLNSEQPLAALWPLLRTWTRLAEILPAESPERLAWQQAMHQVSLLGEQAVDRNAALDAYLNLVAESVEEWGRQAGA